MSDVVCGIMGALDVLAGILLLITGVSVVMVIGGIMIGKGVISFF